MIQLTPEIEKDLVGDINNFDLVVIISSGAVIKRLSTEAQELYDFIDEENQSEVSLNYYDDLITKVSNIKESIDIKDRKLKFGGASITISNSREEIEGSSSRPLRFTDIFRGNLVGAFADVYVKTASCIALTQCIKIASLKITSMKHSSKEVTLRCEDRFIDDFHKELPLSEYTLYEGVNTTVGDNERRIPVLYGHLNNAPSVVFIEGDGGQSGFIENNLIVIPDRAYIDGYQIMGVKSDSPHINDPQSVNQIIEQNILKIKLGDHAATVYSTPPDRLHRELVQGNSKFDNEYPTDWQTQFEVAEDGSHVRFSTSSLDVSPKNISSGNLLCGEVSKCIGIKKYFTRILRPDNLTVFGEELEQLLYPYVTQAFNESENITVADTDMLSLPSIKFTDYSSELKYNTESFIFSAIDTPLGQIDLGSHFNFDLKTMELEFEELKSSIDKSSGKEDDVFTDANLISRIHTSIFGFQNPNNIINASGDLMEHFEYCIYPQQANQESSEDSEYTITNFETDENVDISKDILGLPPLAVNSITSNYISGGIDSLSVGIIGLPDFTKRLSDGAPIRITSFFKGVSATQSFDNRHPFHNTNNGFEDVNSWINNYKLSEQADWSSQNIYTLIAFPKPQIDSHQFEFSFDFASSFSGMMLKRTWYQKECYSKNFFLNAKGKFKVMPNDEQLNDFLPRIVHVKNAELKYFSDENLIGTSSDEKTKDNNLFFTFYDYLTKNRFKKYHTSKAGYQLVVTGNRFEEDDSIIFDIDVNDFRVNREDNIDNYRLSIDFNIFRQSVPNPFGAGGFFFDEDSASTIDSSIKNLKLRYARPIMVDNIIDSWQFLDIEEDEPSEEERPFVIATNYGLNSEVYVSLIDESLFDIDDTEGILINIYKDVNDNDPGDISITEIESEITEEYRTLIRKPSEVVEDLVQRELGINLPVSIEDNLTDDNYELDFSLYKPEKGIDVMQKISQCSPFMYKTNTSTGEPSIVPIKPFYSESDAKINVNNIFKYNFSKTPKQDLALNCRVKYAFDYAKEEYTKVTEDVSHSIDNNSRYLSYYNIAEQSQDSYTLEFEAPYIQDDVTARILAKHLFELHKNQHLKISFDIPITDAIRLEVGDIVSFVDDENNLSKIDDIDPYGIDIRSASFLYTNDGYSLKQALFPFFMITSISKDTKQAKIEVIQMHELAPSEFDNWTLFPWEDASIDPDTGEINLLPYIIDALVVDTQLYAYPTQEVELEFSFLAKDDDQNGEIQDVNWKIIKINTGDTILSGSADFSPFIGESYNWVQGSGTINFNPSDYSSDPFGDYYLSLTPIDNNGMQGSSYVMQFNYAAFIQTPPQIIATYMGGLQGSVEGISFFGTIGSTTNPTNFRDNQFSYNLPYNEEHEVNISMISSYATIPTGFFGLSPELEFKYTVQDNFNVGSIIEEDWSTNIEYVLDIPPEVMASGNTLNFKVEARDVEGNENELSINFTMDDPTVPFHEITLLENLSTPIDEGGSYTEEDPKVYTFYREQINEGNLPVSSSTQARVNNLYITEEDPSWNGSDFFVRWRFEYFWMNNNFAGGVEHSAGETIIGSKQNVPGLNPGYFTFNLNQVFEPHDNDFTNYIVGLEGEEMYVVVRAQMNSLNSSNYKSVIRYNFRFNTPTPQGI